MARALALLLLLALVRPGAASAQVPARTSAVGPPLVWARLGEATDAARQTGRPVLVYVRAAWCGPCRRLERNVLADAAVRARLGRLHLARLDIDGDETVRMGPHRASESVWAVRLGADVTPTLLLLSPAGTVIGRHAGLVSDVDLVRALDAALTAAPVPGVASSRRLP